MNFKAITASVAALMMGATPTLAATQAELNAHDRLLKAVGSTGVSVYINPPLCDSEGAPMGFYNGRDKVMVICQDNKVAGVGTQVDWTPNDLDTIRHEAHHVAQDCRDGVLDADLHPVYKDPIAFGRLIMGQEGIEYVADTYSEASKKVIVLEIEAFAVAANNDIPDQLGDIQSYCF
jgi:hypothetical protein